ncbi:protease inhibitor I42 family protein [Trinickia fusca]|nr:protease inhibitor I42 family protein [Trinickia fusca]
MTLPVFSQADDGSMRVLPTPGEFALELEETPTTGYRWQLDFDQALTLLSSDLALADGAPPGAGGIRRWVFQIDQPGEFSIRAKLWREWQGEGSVISRCRLTVQVLN